MSGRYMSRLAPFVAYLVDAPVAAAVGGRWDAALLPRAISSLHCSTSGQSIVHATSVRRVHSSARPSKDSSRTEAGQSGLSGDGEAFATGEVRLSSSASGVTGSSNDAHDAAFRSPKHGRKELSKFSRMLKEAFDQINGCQPQHMTDLPSFRRHELTGDESGVADATNEPFPDLRVSLHTYPTANGTQLAVDDEDGCMYWQYDLLGFSKERNAENALLSEAAKRLMYELNKENPQHWSVEYLSQVFRVRQQRVAAILYLQGEEDKQDGDLLELLQSLSGCTLSELVLLVDSFRPVTCQEERRGDRGRRQEDEEDEDEKSYNPLKPVWLEGKPEAGLPEYGVLLEELSDAQKGVWHRLEQLELQEQLHLCWSRRLWQEVLPRGAGEQHVVSVPSAPHFAEMPLEAADAYTENEVSAVNALLTRQSDKEMVTGFLERLSWNTGRSGPSIQRSSRRHTRPPKPSKGWSLVVRPAGRSTFQPFVVEGDGQQRALTEDEALYLRRGSGVSASKPPALEEYWKKNLDESPKEELRRQGRATPKPGRFQRKKLINVQ